MCRERRSSDFVLSKLWSPFRIVVVWAFSTIIQLQTTRWFVSSSNIFKYIDGNCQDKRQEHLPVTPLLINVWDRDSKWGINNVCFAAISSWFPIFLIFISCLLQTPCPVCGSRLGRWLHQINVPFILRITFFPNHLLQHSQCWPAATDNVATTNIIKHLLLVCR